MFYMLLDINHYEEPHYWRQVSETGHLWSEIDGIYVLRPPRPHICCFFSFTENSLLERFSLCPRDHGDRDFMATFYLDVFTMRSSLPRRFCDHSARLSMRHEHRTFRVVVLDTDAGGDISLIQRTHTSTFQLFIFGVLFGRRFQSQFFSSRAIIALSASTKSNVCKKTSLSPRVWTRENLNHKSMRISYT